jgi:ribonuclease G
VVDSRKSYEKIMKFLDKVAPYLKLSVELYDGSTPIFDSMGIEIEFSRLLNNKVWLKSGGFIIIDSTEALTSTDVNTGKYVGKRNLEETIFKTNMEAVKEIATQLRLRNIGGIIIIDFIDMTDLSNRDEVFNALKEALKKDPCKTNILKISEIGLVQMTRQRNRESLHGILCESCYYCEGKGFLKSKRTVCYEIFRRIQHDMRHCDSDFPKGIDILAHPHICAMLMKEEARNLELLEKMINKTISIHSRKDFYIEQYEINYL